MSLAFAHAFIFEDLEEIFPPIVIPPVVVPEDSATSPPTNNYRPEPYTGDNSNLLLFLILFILSGIIVPTGVLKTIADTYRKRVNKKHKV